MMECPTCRIRGSDTRCKVVSPVPKYESFVSQLSHKYVCEHCDCVRYVCNYCDRDVSSGSGIIRYLLDHIGSCHVPSMFGTQSITGNNGILEIQSDRNSIYSGDFVYVFPQLSLLKVNNIDQYEKYMKERFRLLAHNMQMDCVVGELTEENAGNNYDLSNAYGAELIKNITYCCVSCGMEYESGIPDIHIVVSHFVKCAAKK